MFDSLKGSGDDYHIQCPSICVYHPGKPWARRLSTQKDPATPALESKLAVPAAAPDPAAHAPAPSDAHTATPVFASVLLCYVSADIAPAAPVPSKTTTQALDDMFEEIPDDAYNVPKPLIPPSDPPPPYTMQQMSAGKPAAAGPLRVMELPEEFQMSTQTAKAQAEAKALAEAQALPQAALHVPVNFLPHHQQPVGGLGGTAYPRDQHQGLSLHQQHHHLVPSPRGSSSPPEPGTQHPRQQPNPHTPDLPSPPGGPLHPPHHHLHAYALANPGQTPAGLAEQSQGPCVADSSIAHTAVAPIPDDDFGDFSEPVPASAHSEYMPLVPHLPVQDATSLGPSASDNQDTQAARCPVSASGARTSIPDDDDFDEFVTASPPAPPATAELECAKETSALPGPGPFHSPLVRQDHPDLSPSPVPAKAKVPTATAAQPPSHLRQRSLTTADLWGDEDDSDTNKRDILARPSGPAPARDDTSGPDDWTAFEGSPSQSRSLSAPTPPPEPPACIALSSNARSSTSQPTAKAT
eukprot:gene2018-474_t